MNYKGKESLVHTLIACPVDTPLTESAEIGGTML